MRYLAFQLRAPLVFAVAVLWGGVAAGMPPVGTTRSGGSLVLELNVADEQLRIDLINSSDHPIKVNKRFLYGIKVAWTDVVFLVQDAKGNPLPYLTKSTADMPRTNDWCDLSPDEFTGKTISLDRLKTDYGLKKGTYTIRAEYFMRAENGDVVLHLNSSAISVSIGS
jgi:hypothetical protein